MINYKITIQYDGTGYKGWQFQPNQKTIQGEIENALLQIFKLDKINLIGSGRTDSGVHANDQVANFKVETHMQNDQIVKAINSKLSNDIIVTSCKKVSDSFNSRFSAVKREYKYFINFSKTPFTRNHIWTIDWDINTSLIIDCAREIQGEHEFEYFSKSSSETKNKLCNVVLSKWELIEKNLIFTISSNRFLQHMVRYLVGTMIEVARGRYVVEDFIDLLHNRGNKSVVRAPAHGLYLNRVIYEE